MLRLFVAAYPDAPWAAEALRLLDTVALPPRTRRTPSDALHLTLQFIGDTAEKDLAVVIQSVERCAAGLSTFDLAPTRLIALPERGSARLIALELDAPPTLVELHTRLASRLARNPRAPKTKFLPHLTLCRFEPTAAPPGLPRDVQLSPFRVGEVLVMRSNLGPAGAIHAALRPVTLAGPMRR